VGVMLTNCGSITYTCDEKRKKNQPFSLMFVGINGQENYDYR
jgi:hypothetical protein